MLDVPVVPVEARRLYRLSKLIEPQPTEGGARFATEEDHKLVARLRQHMVAAIGTQPSVQGDHDAFARRMIMSKRLWLWDNGGGVTCMVAATKPGAGVARIFGVYTPPDHRGRGYATACTAAATQALLEEGSTPVLYTQLSNATSNGIYRRLGYRPVSELLIYRFGDDASHQPTRQNEPGHEP